MCDWLTNYWLRNYRNENNENCSLHCDSLALLIINKQTSCATNGGPKGTQQQGALLLETLSNPNL